MSDNLTGREQLKANLNRRGKSGGKAFNEEAGKTILKHMVEVDREWLSQSVIMDGVETDGSFRAGFAFLHEHNYVERWGGPESAIRATHKGVEWLNEQDS